MHYTIFELDQYRNHVMSCHVMVSSHFLPVAPAALSSLQGTPD